MAKTKLERSARSSSSGRRAPRPAPTGAEATPAGPGASGSGDDGPLLGAAAAAVTARWAGHPDAEDVDLVDEVELVRRLVGDSVVSGEETGDLSGRATALRRRILSDLRSEVISRWERPLEGEGDESPRVWSVLRAIESVERRLKADWNRRFGVELGQPCGMDVAAEIAHGLRSSCTSLLFVAEVLREGMYGELNEKQAQQVEILYGGTIGLSTALSDLTEIALRSRQEAGEEETALELPGILRWIDQLLRPVANAKGTRLGISVDSVGNPYGHPDALKRAILHLTLHALFAASGGSVEVDVGSPADGVGIDVRITGRDGAREAAPEAEPFRILREGLEEGEYAFSSARLRLHMARELVRSMGSELDYRTDEDGGVVAAFSLGAA